MGGKAGAGWLESLAISVVGAGQIGGIGQADQHHFGGLQGVAGARNFVIALEQDLPGAGQSPHRQLAGQFGAAGALVGGQRHIVGSGRHHLDAGDQMGEIGEIGHQGLRIGAGIVKGAHAR